MRAKNRWLKLVQILMVSLGLVAGGVCLLIFLDFAHGGWPRRPFGGFRPEALLNFALGFGAVALAGAGMLSNVRRIGRGEGVGRFFVALAGAAATLTALFSVSCLVAIAQTFLATPMSSKLATLLFLACVLPFLVLLVVVALAGLKLCFAERAPPLAGVTRILTIALPYAAGAACVMSVIAAARQRDLSDAFWVAGPTMLGLLALTAVLAARVRVEAGGWALARAVAGYALGAVAIIVLSAFIDGVGATHDPRETVLSVIVFGPVALAAAALFGFALLLASGQVGAGYQRIRRALA